MAEQNDWENAQQMNKQRKMKCPDLSNTIIFERYINWEIVVMLEVTPTCAEYFDLTEPCIGITCNENASCMTKGNSFECSCNDGFIKTNDSTDNSGWF